MLLYRAFARSMVDVYLLKESFQLKRNSCTNALHDIPFYIRYAIRAYLHLFSAIVYTCNDLKIFYIFFPNAHCIGTYEYQW